MKKRRYTFVYKYNTILLSSPRSIQRAQIHIGHKTKAWRRFLTFPPGEPDIEDRREHGLPPHHSHLLFMAFGMPGKPFSLHLHWVESATTIWRDSNIIYYALLHPPTIPILGGIIYTHTRHTCLRTKPTFFSTAASWQTWFVCALIYNLVLKP